MKPRHSSTAADSLPLVREPIPARRSRASVHTNRGIKIERDIVIDRPAPELFNFWRKFDNLPRVMKHLESVECLDERRSRWRMRRGNEVTAWVAEISTSIRTNSLPGARCPGRTCNTRAAFGLRPQRMDKAPR